MVTGILAQLHAHQAQVTAGLADTRALLAAESIDIAATADTRRKFARLLTDYQVFKHQRIFDPLARHGEAADAAVARQLKIGCVAMGETFRAHLGRWNAMEIADRRAEYRRDATGMVTMIERHMRSELREIEALLAPKKRAA